jgi:hypothetical protein
MAGQILPIVSVSRGNTFFSLLFGVSHSLCGILDNLHRIVERGYEPSDDDVLRVSSPTMPGVHEYHFWPENGELQPVCSLRVLLHGDFVSRTRRRTRVDFLRYWVFKNSRAFDCSISASFILMSRSELHGFHTLWM